LFVKTGLAKIFGVTDKGVHINADLIFENELFWVNPANYQSRDAFFIEPMRHSKLLFLPISLLSEQEIASLPFIMMNFYRERLKRIHQQKIRNYDLELKERVFFLLFDFCLIYGTPGHSHYSMPNFFTHEDLASMLRNCRQNITASFNELKKEGRLNYDRRKIFFEKQLFEQTKAGMAQRLVPEKSSILQLL